MKELEDLTTRAVKNYGYTDAETAIIRDMLLYAQLRGNNQGVVKLIGQGIPKNMDAGDILIEKETTLLARINGNQNHAMVVANKALEVVLEKAKSIGLGIVGTHNTSTAAEKDTCDYATATCLNSKLREVFVGSHGLFPRS